MTYAANGELAKTGSVADDPDQVTKPKRRVFEAAFKLRVLDEWDRTSTSVERSAILRREGLYSSTISDWKRQRRAGTLIESARRPDGRGGPSYAEVERLRQENQRLRQQLAKAELVIEVQGKVSALLEDISKSAATDEAPTP